MHFSLSNDFKHWARKHRGPLPWALKFKGRLLVAYHDHYDNMVSCSSLVFEIQVPLLEHYSL